MKPSTLTIALALLVVAGLAVWQLYASNAQPAGHSMVPPDTSDLGPGDAIVKVKVPATFSDQAKLGKTAFEAKCAVCHGQNAAGRNGKAPPLVHKIYEPSHHSDMAFILAAKNGVRAHHWRFGDMPPVEGLTQGDVKSIALYVRELQRANGIN